MRRVTSNGPLLSMLTLTFLMLPIAAAADQGATSQPVASPAGQEQVATAPDSDSQELVSAVPAAESDGCAPTASGVGDLKVDTTQKLDALGIETGWLPQGCGYCPTDPNCECYNQEFCGGNGAFCEDGHICDCIPW